MTLGPWAVAFGAFLSCVALAAPAAKSWRLPFWIDGEVEGVKDSDVSSHPCGATVLLAVSSIPVRRRNIDTEKVIEFDAAAKVVREWRTPVDFPPVALDGTRLIVTGSIEDEERHLAILPSGKIEDASSFSPAAAGAELQCPAAVRQQFGPSEYLLCERWVDRSSDAKRMVAFEGPCT